MRHPAIHLTLLVALTLVACDQDGTSTWTDTSTDTSVVVDTSADLPPDTSVDASADAPTDLPVDTVTDTATDGSDGSGGGDGPLLLYDGAVGATSLVPGWNPDHPRPLIVLTRYSSETTWHVSMAQVTADGVVGGMVTDVVRVFGWGDFSAYAPTLLYEGPRDGSAVISSWSSTDPFPLIVLTRYTGSDTWNVSMAEITADGVVGGMVTDELVVWGWTSDADPGAPSILYDGAVGGAISGWNASDPDPLIVMTTMAVSDTWWLSMAEVSDTGAVSGMLTELMRVFGW